MKAILNAKILTGVMILFFSCLSLGAEETFETCVRKEKVNKANADSCKEKLQGDSSDGKYSSGDVDRCLSEIAESKCEGHTSKSDIKETKQSCEAAFDKYSEAATKEKEACAAFETTGSKYKNSCQDKINACEKKITNLNNPYGSNIDTEGADTTITDIAVFAIKQNLGVNNQNQSTNSLAMQNNVCVKSIDRKARAQEKKDKDRERRDLMDKITEQKKEITKLKEELNEKDADIKEKMNEIEAAAKEKDLEKDKSISDETARVSKELVEIGKRLRQRNLTITNHMQSLAKENFSYQTAMAKLSDAKIAERCKAEFDAYKAALIAGGNIPGLSPEEKAKVAALSADYKSRGLRGSAEMKKMLKATRQACYDSANTERNAAKLSNSHAVKNIQDKIDEEKNAIKDDKNAITTAQQDLAKLKEHIEKEKATGSQTKVTQLDAFSKQLNDFSTTIDEKTRVANEKIAELTNEINNAMMVQNFEVEDAFSEAEEAINKGTAGRARALEACDCEGQGKIANKSICNLIIEDKDKKDGKKPKTKTRNAN